MWPPSRSDARSASSRLTRPPPETPASEDRRSVSCITSAAKAPSAIRVAVRQTPLTATESPSPISAVSGVRTVSRTPSGGASTASTAPRSWTRPVNTTQTLGIRRARARRSPVPQAGGDQHVVADALHVERQRPGGVRDALGALPLERVARRGAAEHQRRQEVPQLVDLPRVEEGAGQVRP